MLKAIKDFFRKRTLNAHASDTDTVFLPLDKIKTASVLIDAENPSYDILKEKVLAWFKENSIKGEIYYIDFRRLDKKTLLLTSIQTTIIRKDLNWLGVPSMEKIGRLLQEESDLFISLTDKKYFINTFMSKCAKARFKIGRIPMDNKTYNFVISSKPDSPAKDSSLEVFHEITSFISNIK